MEWHLNVPKIFHVYWGGSVLPYIRYATITSFKKFNPDWEIMFWYPKYPFVEYTWNSTELKYLIDCDDYLPELMKSPIKKTAIDFEEINFKNDV